MKIYLGERKTGKKRKDCKIKHTIQTNGHTSSHRTTRWINKQFDVFFWVFSIQKQELAYDKICRHIIHLPKSAAQISKCKPAFLFLKACLQPGKLKHPRQIYQPLGYHLNTCNRIKNYQLPKFSKSKPISINYTAYKKMKMRIIKIQQSASTTTQTLCLSRINRLSHKERPM